MSLESSIFNEKRDSQNLFASYLVSKSFCGFVNIVCRYMRYDEIKKDLTLIYSINIQSFILIVNSI